MWKRLVKSRKEGEEPNEPVMPHPPPPQGQPGYSPAWTSNASPYAVDYSRSPPVTGPQVPGPGSFMSPMAVDYSRSQPTNTVDGYGSAYGHGQGQGPPQYHYPPVPDAGASISGSFASPTPVSYQSPLPNPSYSGLSPAAVGTYSQKAAPENENGNAYPPPLPPRHPSTNPQLTSSHQIPSANPYFKPNPVFTKAEHVENQRPVPREPFGYHENHAVEAPYTSSKGSQNPTNNEASTPSRSHENASPSSFRSSTSTGNKANSRETSGANGNLSPPVPSSRPSDPPSYYSSPNNSSTRANGNWGASSIPPTPSTPNLETRGPSSSTTKSVAPQGDEQHVSKYTVRIFCQRKREDGDIGEEIPRDIREFRLVNLALIRLSAGGERYVLFDVVFGALDQAIAPLVEKHWYVTPKTTVEDYRSPIFSGSSKVKKICPIMVAYKAHNSVVYVEFQKPEDEAKFMMELTQSMSAIAHQNQ